VGTSSFFSFLYFPSLSKAILKTVELPALRNVVSSIHQLFVPHFVMSVFMCIQLQYRISRQRKTSFEFSSIDCLSSKIFNHGLNHSKIHKARQFCDFQRSLFRQSAGSICMSGHLREISYLYNYR